VVQSKQNKSGSSFFAGVVVGGVIGAAAAFLFSPSGKELRQNIGEQSLLLGRKSSDFIQLAKEKSSYLGKTMSRTSAAGRRRKAPEADKELQMIPIPKDYI